MKLKIVFGLFVFLSFFSNVSAQENYYVNENKETEDAIVMVRTFEVK